MTQRKADGPGPGGVRRSLLRDWNFPTSQCSKEFLQWKPGSDGLVGRGSNLGHAYKGLSDHRNRCLFGKGWPMPELCSAHSMHG